METFEQFLEVKESQIPNAGQGLYTTVAIKKGEKIIEYTGKITTWDEADHMDGDNPFLFHVSDDHVIDGSKDEKAIARYANDAKGLTKIKGLNNNSEFIEEGLRVFIIATKNISAGSEILVSYGPDYWKTVRENIKIQQRIDAMNAEKAELSNKKGKAR